MTREPKKTLKKKKSAVGAAETNKLWGGLK
jgi:hypothetical protein